MGNLESSKYISIDSKKLYLGRFSLGESERILLGTSTVKWLRDFTLELRDYFKSLSNSDPETGVFVSTSINRASAIVESIEPFLKRLDVLTSKKIFVE